MIVTLDSLSLNIKIHINKMLLIVLGIKKEFQTVKRNLKLDFLKLKVLKTLSLNTHKPLQNIDF